MRWPFYMISVVLFLFTICPAWALPDPSRKDPANIYVVHSPGKIDSLSNELAGLKQRMDDSEKDNNTSNTIAIIAVAISLITICFSYLQYRDNQKIIRSDVAVGLFNEFREEQWDKCRMIISSEGEKTDFEQVKRYSHLLNHFGFLLEHKFINAESIFDMMGVSVILAWTCLEKQIRERRIRGAEMRKMDYPYQYHFQYLYCEMLEIKEKRMAHVRSIIEKCDKIEMIEKKNEAERERERIRQEVIANAAANVNP